MNTGGDEFSRAYERAVERLKSLSGKSHAVSPTNEAATKDAIRRFADGIGDPNPLWRDEHYASRSRYACLVAPPTFLYSVVSPQSGVVESIPGLIRYDAGCEWEWFKTIDVNDSFSVTNTFEDVVVKRAEPAGQRLFMQSGRLTYCNQKKEVAAESRWMLMRAESSPNLKSDPNPNPNNVRQGPGRQQRYKYTAEELAEIDRGYDAEERRGAQPRYWEDVETGAVIRPVVKGPLTHADMVAFVVGTGMMGQAHSLSPVRAGRLSFWEDPETGVKEPGDGIHFVDKVAQGIAGLPFAINFGIQRVCWLGHMLTNWMGDDGFLERLSVQYRKPSYLGETTWCRGKVVKRDIKDGEHRVECDVWCENQKKEVHTTGHATVVLPSKV